MDIFLGALFVVICVLLIVVVLLQKGRGGGLGAAFGGAGSSAFGTRTGDVFTWVTIVLTALFLLLAIGTTVLFRAPKRTVATPVLTPAGGPIDKETTVVISCKTSDVRICHATDGSEPSQEQATDFSPANVQVKPGETLKVRGYVKYGKSWIRSELVVQEYKKGSPEATPPTSLPSVPSQPPGATGNAG